MAQNADPHAVPKAAPGRPVETISTARKVRLVLLCVVLLALMAAAGVMALQRRAAERARARQISEALDQMRQSLGEMDLVAVEARYKKVKELDPGNAEADRLLVPVYLAAGQVDAAAKQFNALVDAGVVQAPAAPGGADPAVAAVLTRLQPARLLMQQGDARYITNESLLETLARRVTRGAAADRERALVLCRWFALHVEPADPYSMPVDPYVVVWRGFGSRQQAAWAYAEMARQAGVACAVVVPASGAARLVQVYPAGSGPFLVDPGRGVPLLDAASGELLSLASPGLADGCDALLALAGEKPDYGPQDLKAATLQWAVPPSALMPRFSAFDRLIAPLPARPRLAFEPGPLPDGRPAALWRLPFQMVEAYTDPARAASFEQAHRWLSRIGRLSDLLLQQPDAKADAVLSDVRDQLTQALAKPGNGQTAAILRDEVEAVSFWQGTNAHDAGEHARALELLKAYSDAYPKGHWSAVAAALRADSLAQSGQADAAKAAWGRMPPGRRLYGAMRAAGMLPLSEQPRAR